MRRLTVEEAAEVLGITTDDVRIRISHGTLPSESDGKRVCVLLDDMATYDRPGESNVLISELRERVRYLEGIAATRDEEIRRRDHIIAGLLERVPAAIEPPSNPPESPPAPRVPPDMSTVSPNPEKPSSPPTGASVVLVVFLVVAMLVAAIYFGILISS